MRIRSVLRVFGAATLLMILTMGVIFSTSVVVVLYGRSGNAKLPADCAIVFGAAVRAIRNQQGSVVAEDAGPGIARRVATAADLWKQGKIHHIFLSGGTGEGMGRSESEVMAQRAQQLGVPASALTVEDQSTSTKENLINTRPLTKGCSSLVGISDDYHLARIGFLAWQLGWNLQTLPAERQSNTAFEISSVIRESFALIYYALVS